MNGELPINRLLLGVNIDHIATLRQARGTPYPDPIQAAIEAEQAGADAITLHLREDRRHIQERDVYALKDILLTRMNLEMAVTDEMLEIAEKIKPKDCCLVPERREELTTEGGLDVLGQQAKVSDACSRLSHSGTTVSLFIDPDCAQLDAAAACGARVVELHTGNYADAKTDAQQLVEFNRIKTAMNHGVALGLQINAGHGLNYQNIGPIAALANLKELNIGHAIIARSVFTGLKNAVSEMQRLMVAART